MLVEWVKQRFNLCTRKRWHFAPTFRVWHGGRYCTECWRSEMQSLDNCLARRIELTGVDSRRDVQRETHDYMIEERLRSMGNAGHGIAQALTRFADLVYAELLRARADRATRGRKRR